MSRDAWTQPQGPVSTGLAVVKGVTARFTWRDLFSNHHNCLLYESDRARLGVFASPALNRAVRADLGVGGLLMWNATRMDYGGHMVMLTGQQPDRESVVMDNAYALTAMGSVHSSLGARVFPPDHRLSLGRDKDEFYVWLIRNDRKIATAAMAETVATLRRYAETNVKA